jgi:hypothetical protein
MLFNRAHLALLDIRDNIRLAEDFAAGLSLDAFIADRLTFYAEHALPAAVESEIARFPDNSRGGPNP